MSDNLDQEYEELSDHEKGEVLREGGYIELEDAKQYAILALARECGLFDDDQEPLPKHLIKFARAIEALAQQEKPEPFCFTKGYYGGYCVVEPFDKSLVIPENLALYTQPPRNWLPR